jgi:hypothetical protein
VTVYVCVCVHASVRACVCACVFVCLLDATQFNLVQFSVYFNLRFFLHIIGVRKRRRKVLLFLYTHEQRSVLGVAGHIMYTDKSRPVYHNEGRIIMVTYMD